MSALGLFLACSFWLETSLSTDVLMLGLHVFVFVSNDCSSSRVKEGFHGLLSILFHSVNSTNSVVGVGDLGYGHKKACPLLRSIESTAALASFRYDSVTVFLLWALTFATKSSISSQRPSSCCTMSGDYQPQWHWSLLSHHSGPHLWTQISYWSVLAFVWT